MKAIDPVIATLILIAIAVIAGVFVLRQFLGLGTSVRPAEAVQIQDLVFRRRVSSDMKTQWVNVEYTVKNTGTRMITLEKVEIPDAKPYSATFPNKVTFEKIIKQTLGPGDTYQDAFTVLDGVDYDTVWDLGTVHEFKVYFYIHGNPVIQVATQTGRVVP